jgi:hypothetical protein
MESSREMIQTYSSRNKIGILVARLVSNKESQISQKMDL